jgi:glucokinase
LEIDLLRFLLKKHQHVSYERLISGPGIFSLYEFFRSKADYPEPDWLRKQHSSGDPSAAISQAALDGTDPVCAQALDLFVSLYGAEAGNLALKLLATGGVYIAGGIAPKILEKISEGSFMHAFATKGRHEALLKTIPVRVVLNDKTALFGAAHYALMMNE